MSRTSPVFNLRMPLQLKEKITAQAEANKRSINAEIVAAIEYALQNAADNESHKVPWSAEIVELFRNEIGQRFDQLEEKIEKLKK